MRKYKAVIFDLYGTLLDIHTDESHEQLWEKMAHFYRMHGAYYDAQSLKAHYASLVEHDLERQKNKGIDYPDIEILKVFKGLYLQAQVKANKSILQETARLFRVLSLSYVTTYPGAFELLKALKDKGYRLVLLSNAQAAFTNDELIATGLDHAFDRVYLSSDYKVCKPSMRYFQTMLKGEKLLAEECLFIGNDHIADIEGASLVGMDSIYLHTNCSQAEVPDAINAKWRVQNGSLETLLALLVEENIL